MKPYILLRRLCVFTSLRDTSIHTSVSGCLIRDELNDNSYDSFFFGQSRGNVQNISGEDVTKYIIKKEPVSLYRAKEAIRNVLCAYLNSLQLNSILNRIDQLVNRGKSSSISFIF
jgi:hypothetical protein